VRDRSDLMQLRERAAREKELAKQSFAGLKQALRPSSIATRLGRKATVAASDVAGGVADSVRAHLGLTTSLAVGTGLVVLSKPLGALIADGLSSTKADSE